MENAGRTIASARRERRRALGLQSCTKTLKGPRRTQAVCARFPTLIVVAVQQLLNLLHPFQQAPLLQFQHFRGDEIHL